MCWHNEVDTDRMQAFEENRKTFKNFNPSVEIITLISPFTDKNTAWLSTDLTVFHWFKKYGSKKRAKRYLIVEWDCWCDCKIKDYYSRVWDCDLVVPNVKYPERDDWHWFSTANLLPNRAKPYLSGITPLCGILISRKAMLAISKEIMSPDYLGLNSELRLATIATMLNFDPIVNPAYNRALGWRHPSFFDTKYTGLHHPRKILPKYNRDQY